MSVTQCPYVKLLFMPPPFLMGGHIASPLSICTSRMKNGLSHTMAKSWGIFVTLIHIESFSELHSW